MADIIEQLRTECLFCGPVCKTCRIVEDRAAAEIQRLRAELVECHRRLEQTSDLLLYRVYEDYL